MRAADTAVCGQCCGVLWTATPTEIIRTRGGQKREAVPTHTQTCVEGVAGGAGCAFCHPVMCHDRLPSAVICMTRYVADRHSERSRLVYTGGCFVLLVATRFSRWLSTACRVWHRCLPDRFYPEPHASHPKCACAVTMFRHASCPPGQEQPSRCCSPFSPFPQFRLFFLLAVGYQQKFTHTRTR
jgi:hypothetical protein